MSHRRMRVETRHGRVEGATGRDGRPDGRTSLSCHMLPAGASQTCSWHAVVAVLSCAATTSWHPRSSPDSPPSEDRRRRRRRRRRRPRSDVLPLRLLPFHATAGVAPTTSDCCESDALDIVLLDLRCRGFLRCSGVTSAWRSPHHHTGSAQGAARVSNARSSFPGPGPVLFNRISLRSPVLDRVSALDALWRLFSHPAATF